MSSPTRERKNFAQHQSNGRVSGLDMKEYRAPRYFCRFIFVSGNNGGDENGSEVLRRLTGRVGKGQSGEKPRSVKEKRTKRRLSSREPILLASARSRRDGGEALA